jgi:primosomal protein N' (replication factor Y) (superfamily II helicase)
VARFSARFGAVAVLHSHLTDAERAAEWRRIRRGEAAVAIGARSAVFAPMPRLGLIIIDEEHETSFKQDTAPRYHARDVAIVRAQAAGAAVVLGGATPSLETFVNAQRGKFILSVLPARVAGRPMPPVEAIDMRAEKERTGRMPLFSPRLAEAVGRALDRREQIILFLNRRGFHTFITCARCGFVARCSQCDVALTYHQGQRAGGKGQGVRSQESGVGGLFAFPPATSTAQAIGAFSSSHKSEIINHKFSSYLACHHCGLELAPFDSCPQCRARGLLRLGRGTERIEDAARALWPHARVARMDSDVMKTRRAYEETLSAFGRGDIDVLVGTQMIAKGLDFPNVTVVGIIDADTALNLPDFRASERTFQLIAQVAGRTARGDKGGVVIVQTCQPESTAIQAAIRHDYAGFAAAEIDARRRYRFPPFARLARVILRGPSEEKVRERAAFFAEALKTAAAGRADVRGPAPCPIAQIRGEWRFHVILHAPDSATTAAVLRSAADSLAPITGVAIAVDVDPMSML